MEDCIVQYDDTLETIAEKKLGDKNRWFEIARLNNIQTPFQLFVGQTIKLPPKQTVGIVPPPPLVNQLPPAILTLARGSLFVVFEQLPEIGSDKVIRKIAIAPFDFSRHPHLTPTNSFATVTPAEHALGNKKSSQYLSASNRPYGSPTNVVQDIPDNLKGKNNPNVNPRDLSANKDLF
jgi:hypothetical protein